MSLNHEFYLVQQPSPDFSYRPYVRGTGRIEIHDAALRYVWDFLKWIPTENPAMPNWPMGSGLNQCGPTVIRGIGAAKAAKIVKHLADLFAEGPEQLSLTGGYTWITTKEDGSGMEPNSGSYETLRCNRDEIVSKLRTLSDWLTTAANEDALVLHCGI